MIITLIALFISGCSSMQTTASPTETIKIFAEATKAKDTKAVQSTFSKGTLAMMEKNAKQHNTTIDELLSRDIGPPIEEIPEMRNELIEGDTASVEVKNGTGNFDKIPLVKEEGVWKIALDKFIEEAMNKMKQEMKNSALNNSNSNRASAPDANSNQPATNK